MPLTFPNSIIVDKTHARAFSADGIGCMRQWSLSKHTFDCVKEIKEPEVRGDAINCLLIDRSVLPACTLQCLPLDEIACFHVAVPAFGIACLHVSVPAFQ